MAEEQDKVVVVPESVEAPIEPEYEVVEAPEAEAEAEPEEEAVEDLSDLTKVSKEDILGKADGNTDIDVSDVVGLSEEDEEELLGVDPEDILGETPEEPKPKVRLVRRVRRRYQPPPPPSVRGVRY